MGLIAHGDKLLVSNGKILGFNGAGLQTNSNNKAITVNDKVINIYKLPNEYQEVEYIESNGQQYINTLTESFTGAKVTYSCEICYTKSNRQLFGNWEPLGVSLYLPEYFEGIIYLACNRSSGAPQIEAELNKFYKAEYTLNNRTSNRPLFLFASNDSIDGVYCKCSCKLKYYKLLVNDVLVRNFIPCYRKSDNEVGMYDTVTNQFYTNQGTGSFTKGKDVNKKPQPYTIHFQQLLNQTRGSARYGDMDYTKNSNGSWTINGTTTTNNHFYNLNYINNVNSCGFIAGHRYFILPNNTNAWVCTNGAQRYTGYPNPEPIFDVTSVNSTTWARIQVNTEVGVRISETIYPMIFDITAMFSDAQEIIPSSLDEFVKLFPKEYYPYTEQPYDVIVYV